MIRKNLIATVQVSTTAQPLLGDIRIDPTSPGFYVGVVLTGVSLVGTGGGGGPYAFSVLSGSMPGGLTLNANGTITGTPTTQGRFEVLAQVQDVSLAVYPFRVIFVVKSGLFPLFATPTPCVRGLAYRYQVLFADATGSTSGITYTVVAGALPSGLTLTTGGLISGTTSVAAATFSFTVRGTKSGSTLDVPMVLVLRNAISSITGTFSIDPALQNMAIGVPVDASIAFASSSGNLGFPPYVWDISVGALPAGLSMDTRGRITGTPTAATSNAYTQPTFRLTDKAGQTRTFTPSAPKISVNSTLAASVRGHFLRADSLGLPTDFDFISLLFGDGHDGDFVLDGTNTYPTVFAKSLGTYTPLRPVYANNLTVSGSGILNANAPIYIADTFDISNAAAGSITLIGPAIDGANGIGALGGTAGIGSSSLLYLGEGGTGTPGATSVVSAVPATPATPTALPGGIDTNGNSSGGNGGSGTSGSGGSGGQGQPAGAFDPPLTPYRGLVNGFGQRVQGGAAGGAGGAGRGNGTSAGGGGGGPGGGAGVMAIYARRVNRGASTAAGAILLKGGNGGNGANATNTNTGGGGPGCGGNSGFFLLTFGELLGTTATNCIKLQGGDAGTPGTGNGTGTSGTTAKGGHSGRAILMDVLTPSVSISAIVTTATATGAIAQVSL